MIEGLERRRNPNVAKTAAFFSILVLLTIISLVGTMMMLVRLNSLVEDNKHNSDYLIECTTPGPNPPPKTGHKCYDDGQQRTADAIKQIVDSLKDK